MNTVDIFMRKEARKYCLYEDQAATIPAGFSFNLKIIKYHVRTHHLRLVTIPHEQKAPAQAELHQAA